MLTIGCHLSSSKGYLAMGKEAVSINAGTFQFFSRNPRGGSVKPLDQADISAYLEFADQNGIRTILAHAPYTLNACSAEETLRAFAQRTMEDDLSRLELIPGGMYVFHPGSHVGQGPEIGISYISGMLNKILKPMQKTRVLLETMAGKGSEVGGRFEEIKAIIDKVELNTCLGVCLDTCHVYDSGYDIVHDLDGVLNEFDQIIGLDRLYAIHLNDSKNPFGSHKDRHETIGQGTLTQEAISRIINHPRLRNLPFYLETPNDVPGYGREIALLKSLYKE